MTESVSIAPRPMAIDGARTTDAVEAPTVPGASPQSVEALRGAWHEVLPVESVRRTARRLLRTHPLRAADSLQLAAALVASEGDPASMEVVALDSRLVEAAQREGLVVVEAPEP